jgi:hypothetical protein
VSRASLSRFGKPRSIRIFDPVTRPHFIGDDDARDAGRWGGDAVMSVDGGDRR